MSRSRFGEVLSPSTEINPSLQGPFTAEQLEQAYRYCKDLARKHYENFPVGSLMIPKHYQPALHSIYAFARIADDIADEGIAPAVDRIGKLDDWQQQLDNCFRGNATHPAFIALADTAGKLNLPKKPFDDLLIAFRMDVTQNRFRTFEDVLYYCRHSANPVGRLVLLVFGGASDNILSLADQLCTALQLANFWQDVSVDLAKGRIYIPLEDLDRFQYTEADLHQRIADTRFCRLIEFQVGRTRTLFNSARQIMDLAPPSLRTELSLTWHGGWTILNKIERSGFDVLTNRPGIGTTDKIRILLKTLLGMKA
jgi:squalene synthase HpnC